MAAFVPALMKIIGEIRNLLATTTGRLTLWEFSTAQPVVCEQTCFCLTFGTAYAITYLILKPWVRAAPLMAAEEAVSYVGSKY